ncbi:MAG: hypothetical protein KatS3mg016_1569 [Fimbriimonadales bacterium]|nr:MAG: hypothetical protein KatS3mg016_1569 [Fimbriimonadales bacterium]
MLHNIRQHLRPTTHQVRARGAPIQMEPLRNRLQALPLCMQQNNPLLVYGADMAEDCVQSLLYLLMGKRYLVPRYFSHGRSMP